MSATTTVPIDRAAVNRANSQLSTGPRSEAGKQRSSLNALRHGLTARTAVLAAEDPAAFERHCSQFLDEYKPATATETQLVQELADTSWRLNRIPRLEADVLNRAQPPAPSPQLSTSSMPTGSSPASACTAHASPSRRQQISPEAAASAYTQPGANTEMKSIPSLSLGFGRSEEGGSTACWTPGRRPGHRSRLQPSFQLNTKLPHLPDRNPLFFHTLLSALLRSLESFAISEEPH
jgi:hypothetical protein